jgi:hypothetical protein
VNRARHVEQLGDAIAELAARLHAATYELLVLLRGFDDACGWNNGFRSCAHWQHWRTGIDLGAAREKVRVANALAALPRLSTAMQCGELSYAEIRALTRVATPKNEAQLLDVAHAGTAAHVERLVRAWRRVDRVEAARQTQTRHLERYLTTSVDEDGMLVLRGRLTPEVGAVVQRALEAAADRLFHESAQTPEPTTSGTLAGEVTAGQRRADALGLLAESALAADLDRGNAGDRYQVVLHVEAGGVATAAHGSEASDASTSDTHAVVEVGDGATYVSAETCERLACDAAVVVMRHTADGSVLDVGRKTRSIPPAIRRALMARDPRCQFPGCTARRCDAHHLTHWAHGGPTCLDNLVHLCRWHHRAVHEGGYQITRDSSGEVRVLRPDGTAVPPVPAAAPWTDVVVRDANRQTYVRGVEPRSADPLAPTSARLEAAGLAVGPYTATPAWDGHPFDVVWAIDVLRAGPVGGWQGTR